MAKSPLGLLFLSTLFLAVACAGKGERLLRQDYQTMSNEELLQYYYQLDEEVAKCEARLGRTSVGVGTGYGSSGFGLGVGIHQGISGCNLDALRQRRGEVRFKLRQEGLSP